MIKNSNFRYRGPLESEKCTIIIKDTIETINELNERINELINNTKSISEDVIDKVKRRGEA